MKPPAMTPAEVRSLRESTGLSQAAFAELIGVIENSVWRWESGDRTVSEPMARLIRRVAAEQPDAVAS